MSRTFKFRIRASVDSDMEGIAKAHRDSLQTLCASYYLADLIGEWSQSATPDRYREAHSQGATIFVAESDYGDILGFSEVHRVKDNDFNSAVFVSGEAVRRGIGTALYRAAESSARAAGAERIELNASLAAIAFYRYQGFQQCEYRDLEAGAGRSFRVLHMRKGLVKAKLENTHGARPGTG